MARIVVGSYMVRYPLGGMLSWVLQYIAGFQRLGHEVFFVEKAGYPEACYDPLTDLMSDDCSHGTKVVNALLERWELQDSWCFVDAAGTYHGCDARRIEQVFDGADVFVDMGTHGSWLDEAASAGLRVLVDGDPGFTQMKMELSRREGEVVDVYDRYYTAGHNVGTAEWSAPTGGVEWKHLFHPVVSDLVDASPPPAGAPFTTVMNWQSYPPLEFDGTEFGQKDVEFPRFMSLPQVTHVPLETAVSGKDVPRDELSAHGWKVHDAHEVTATFDAFWDYIASSAGEFSVCKNAYVATRSAWFSDRSAAYLASGRPVIQQETGFSAYLPCGEGLFAVTDVDEAAAALEDVASDPARHSRRAREIAVEILDVDVVLRRFLDELGV